MAHLAVPLLQLLLQHPSSSPLIVSELLSCTSALFSCVLLQPDALQPVLAKMFQPLTVPNTANSKEVRTLRRHCCALLVKLGTKFPVTLLPTFQFLRAEIDRLNSAGLVTKMEFVTLTEGLVIISNQLQDFSKQSSFLQELLTPITAQLVQLSPQLSSPERFLAFAGLTSPPQQDMNKDPYSQNRSQLTTLVNSLLAITRRAAAPSSPDAAARGGFVQGSPPSSRNPCGPHACLALPHLLQLAQTINKVLGQEVRGQLDQGFAKVFDMLVLERNNILGLPGSRTAKNEVTHSIAKQPEPVMRMQSFVTEIFENLQHLLSYYSTNIGMEFYQQPNLGSNLCLSSLSHLQGLPDFRLRAINKMFLKSFISSCPGAQHSSVVLPVLGQLLPFMMKHLKERWAELKRVREQPGFDEDNTDSQEVLDDVVVRVTAREYLDTLRAALTSTGGGVAVTGGEEGEASPAPSAVTPLGEAVLASPQLSQPLTLTIMAALSWPDSPSSCKVTSCFFSDSLHSSPFSSLSSSHSSPVLQAAALVELVLPRLLDQGTVSSEDAAALMMAVLQVLFLLLLVFINVVLLVSVPLLLPPVTLRHSKRWASTKLTTSPSPTSRCPATRSCAAGEEDLQNLPRCGLSWVFHSPAPGFP